MKKAKMRFTADRRLFLKGAAVAGGAAALTAAAATSLVEPATESDPGTTPAAADKTASKGYHETQHIRDYYRILRS